MPSATSVSQRFCASRFSPSPLYNLLPYQSYLLASSVRPGDGCARLVAGHGDAVMMHGNASPTQIGRQESHAVVSNNDNTVEFRQEVEWHRPPQIIARS